MKLLLSFVSGKIVLNNTMLRAAVCKQCRARIYPIRDLKAHLESHKQKRILH